MSEAGGMRHGVQEQLEKTLEAKQHVEAKLRSVLQVRPAFSRHKNKGAEEG